MAINYERIRYINRGLTAAMRIWTNALGLKFDCWHSCTNWCVYCYARYLDKFALERQHKVFDPASVRLEKIDKVKKQMEKIFDLGQYDETNFIDWAIRNRLAIECGTMGEPFQENDLTFRSTYGFLQILNHYDYPLYVNTKANLLVKSPEYFNLLTSLKHLIVDVTLPGLDDEALKKWEPRAPLASERFELVKRLVDKGANVIISCRPLVPGVTEVNFENYLERLIGAGIKGIHLRPMFIMPNMRSTNRTFFDKVIKENNFEWAKKMYQWRNNAVFNDLIKRGLPICEKAGIALTGSHRYFFRLQGNWNKCDYNLMPNFKDHLFQYTIPTLLAGVYKNRDKEQTLKFKEVMPHIEDKNFKITAALSPFFNPTCDDMAIRGTGYLSLKTMIKENFWGSWRSGIKSGVGQRGIVSSLYDIHLLIKNKQPVRDEEGNVIYKYTPPKERFDLDDANNKKIEV